MIGEFEMCSRTGLSKIMQWKFLSRDLRSQNILKLRYKIVLNVRLLLGDRISSALMEMQPDIYQAIAYCLYA